MDNEEELFIKMCDTPEIQGLWNPRIGDLALDKVTIVGSQILVVINSESCFGIDEDLPASEASEYKKRCTWLPRQEDLQEMIFKIWPEFYPQELASTFCGYCMDEAPESLTSMKQLWLAFVMKEKYNKVWDGEKWVAATPSKSDKEAR